MKIVADPNVWKSLIGRLQRLEVDSPRKWGTLSPGEMLCHLGDATASVLRRGAREAAGSKLRPVKKRPIVKWIGLRSPLHWPHSLKTPATVDPHVDGTRAGEFETDRERAIAGLQEFAGAPAEALAANHSVFGPMTMKDWHRWAYLHTDHHLR